MTDYREENRTRFLQKLIAGTSLMGIAHYLMSLEGCTKDDTTSEDPPEDDDTSGIPRRGFGNTGESLSIYSLGGQATLEEAWAMIRQYGS
jgi:hypothetical protein